MTLTEFLSHRLVPGCCYNVELKTGDGPKWFPLFFKGFRIRYKSSLANSEEDLIPVFGEMTKSGKESRKHFVEYFTGVTDILHITPFQAKISGESSRIIGKDEAFSLLQAQENLNLKARAEILRIVHELNSLKHGIRLYIKKSLIATCRYYVNQVDTGSGFIMSLYVRDFNVVCDIQTDKGVRTYRLENIDTDNWSGFLFKVLQSIEEPDMNGPDVFNDLPDPHPAKQPCLYATECIRMRNANIWFAGLDDDELEKIYAWRTSPWRTSKKNESHADTVKNWWNGEDRSQKCFLYGLRYSILSKEEYAEKS